LIISLLVGEIMGCNSMEKISKPKQKHRKGLWSPKEDEKLRNYILKHGHRCWSSLPITAGKLITKSLN